MNVFSEETTRYEAVVQLVKKDFPELNKATIVISDDNDGIFVAAKAVFVNTCTEEGRIFAKAEQVGHYCRVPKSEPITKFFDALREELEIVSAMVEDGKNGKLHKDVKA